MRVVVLISAAMLAVAVVLVVRRVELGPSILDRVVALDVLVSTLLAAFALFAAWTNRRDLVPIMVVLALVGFVGSVTVARFVAAESEDERRILTPEELARQRMRPQDVSRARTPAAPLAEPGKVDAAADDLDDDTDGGARPVGGRR